MVIHEATALAGLEMESGSRCLNLNSDLYESNVHVFPFSTLSYPFHFQTIPHDFSSLNLRTSFPIFFAFLSLLAM